MQKMRSKSLIQKKTIRQLKGSYNGVVKTAPRHQPEAKKCLRSQITYTRKRQIYLIKIRFLYCGSILNEIKRRARMTWAIQNGGWKAYRCRAIDAEDINQRRTSPQPV